MTAGGRREEYISSTEYIAQDGERSGRAISTHILCVSLLLHAQLDRSLGLSCPSYTKSIATIVVATSKEKVGTR